MDIYICTFFKKKNSNYLTAQLPDVADNQELQLLLGDVIPKFSDETWFLKKWHASEIRMDK